ncbi:hypothetical protein AB0M28_21910 [Streptomyces sp. NPDC051940]|uniref:DUF7919 family protein n=1 Tax=Streptomyces sp. NPDC051940 TaxID=3155675 RepID=UPI003422FED0
MTYYADLTPYAYDRDWAADATRLWQGAPVVNVGRLDRGRPYEQGVVPSELAAVLNRMRHTHRTRQTRGFHFCPLCPSPTSGSYASHPYGSAEIWVRGSDVAFAAPELIAHYVEAHAYLPPAAFVQAVLATA